MWNFYIRIFFGFEHRMSIEEAGKYWDVNIRSVPEVWCRACVTHWSLYWIGYVVVVTTVKRSNLIRWDNLCRLSENDRSHWPTRHKNHMLPFPQFCSVCPLPCILLVILLVRSTYGFIKSSNFLRKICIIEQIIPFCSMPCSSIVVKEFDRLCIMCAEQLALEEKILWFLSPLFFPLPIVFTTQKVWTIEQSENEELTPIL